MIKKFGLVQSAHFVFFTLLIAVTVSNTGVPVQVHANPPIATQPSHSAQLPVITAKNAASMTQLTTLYPIAPDYELFAPHWSPDGKYLAVSSSTFIMLFDTSNFAAKPRLIYQVAASIVFSPDSTLLAALSYTAERSVEVYEVRSGRRLYSIRKLGGKELVNSARFTFSPDSSLLAILNDYQLFTIEARTGKAVASFSGGTTFVFSPDGSMLATTESERYQDAVIIIDTKTGERITGFRISGANAIAVVFSPDGLTIAIKFFTSDIVIYDISTGKQLNRFTTDHDFELYVVRLSFSLDGKMLAAFGAGKTYLWDLTTNSSSIFTYSDYGRYGGTFNKDGSLLLYWDYNEAAGLPNGNMLRVWSIPERRQLLLIEGALDPEFSPDGTMLATWGESGLVIWAVQQRQSTTF